MSNVPLIDGVEEVSADWLRAVFAAQGISAADLQVTGIAPVGQGNLADVVRVRMASDSSAVPTSVVCKLAAASAETRGFAQAFGAYVREARSYQQLLSAHCCRAPHCHHVAVSDDGLQFNLVMEDLSHARAGDQAAGCSVVEAGSALEQLANLHCSHWNDARMSDAEWLIHPRPESAGLTHQMYAQGVEQLRQRYADQLGSAALSVIERVAARVGEWIGTSSERNAVCHNDARVDNFMFIDDRAGAPEAVLLDWQLASYRNPLVDVSYFLTGSISVEDRRAHETTLLRAYFERIREADASLTYDEVLKDYRRQIIAGLVATVGSSVVIPPGQRDALLLALATRNCAAVADWGIP